MTGNKDWPVDFDPARSPQSDVQAIGFTKEMTR